MDMAKAISYPLISFSDAAMDYTWMRLLETPSDNKILKINVFIIIIDCITG
jgi:hypothetical protein